MIIDPRLVDRRREVAEGHANRNLRRLLRVLALAAALGALVWLFLSPWLSAAEVSTAGVVSSATEEILTTHQVVVGTPMILIRAGAVEEAIEGDPWVSDAEVDLRWPDRVVVKISERVPAAWVETSAGWARRALDGHALPGSPSPDDTLGWVHLPTVADAEAATSPLVLGAVEFLAALPPDTAAYTSIRLETGELWATVDGHPVLLGRSTEMEAKATALMALLRSGVPSGSVLVLVAPSHPAVRPVEVEIEEPDVSKLEPLVEVQPLRVY